MAIFFNCSVANQFIVNVINIYWWNLIKMLSFHSLVPSPVGFHFMKQEHSIRNEILVVSSYIHSNLNEHKQKRLEKSSGSKNPNPFSSTLLDFAQKQSVSMDDSKAVQ